MISARRFFSTWLVGALLLGAMLNSTSGQAAELEDLVGDWAILIQLPDAPQMASLSAVSGADGALVATLNTPLGESVIEDIDVIDGQHVMLYMMDLGGQPMDIEVSATVEGDGFEGQVLVGGGAMDLPIEGARVGTDAESALNAKFAELQAALAEPATAVDDAPSTESSSASGSAPETGMDEAGGEVAAQGAGSPGDTAEAAELARLPVDQAQDLLGDWVLKVTTFRGDNYADLKASDEDGFVLVEFALPPPMTVDPIRAISRDGDAVTMNFILNFGSSVIDMTMNLKPEDGRYVGTLIDANNMFNSEVVLLTPEQAIEDKAAAASAGGGRRWGWRRCRSQPGDFQARTRRKGNLDRVLPVQSRGRGLRPADGSRGGRGRAIHARFRDETKDGGVPEVRGYAGSDRQRREELSWRLQPVAGEIRCRLADPL